MRCKLWQLFGKYALKHPAGSLFHHPVRLRCWSGLWGIILLICLFVYALINFVFGFHFLDLSQILSYFPYPDRIVDTDAIQAVITALGTVCFALSYIDSTKARRVNGILLENIISYFFPNYRKVFVLHGCFAILGLYSAADITPKAPRTAAICLIGMLVCLVYALNMANAVCFSRNSRNKLVEKYIKYLLRDANPKISIPAAYQLGQYIGEQYRTHNINLGEPICLRKHWHKREESIIFSMTRLLMLADVPEDVTSKSRDSASTEIPSGDDMAFDSVYNIFLTVFSSETGLEPEYILFLLPAYKDHCENFQHGIQHYSILWANLLSQLKDEEQCAAFVCELLYSSPEVVYPCCGLVRYLHSTYIQHSEGERGWRKCAYFIARTANVVSNLELFSIAKEAQKKKKKVVRCCCRDITILFLCLAFLEEANSPITGVGESFRALFHSELNNNNSIDFLFHWDERLLCEYLSFAYIIFLSLASPGVILPSRIDLNRQIPTIIQQLQCCLNQK